MDEQMHIPEEPRVSELASLALDDVDDAVLAELAAIYGEVDPVPEGLVARMQFAIALDEVYAEVARISRMPVDAALVRGETAQTRTQTMTFSAQSLTAMITVTQLDGERARVDGWVAPAVPVEVRLRTQTDRFSVEVDETGRFSFEEVPVGLAQLSFHGPGDDGPSVVTPMFEL